MPLPLDETHCMIYSDSSAEVLSFKLGPSAKSLTYSGEEHP